MADRLCGSALLKPLAYRPEIWCRGPVPSLHDRLFQHEIARERGRQLVRDGAELRKLEVAKACVQARIKTPAKLALRDTIFEGLSRIGIFQGESPLKTPVAGSSCSFSPVSFTAGSRT